MGLEAVLVSQRAPVVADGHRQEVVLDVRKLDTRSTANEAAGLEVICRPQAVLEQQPARADRQFGQWLDGGVERYRLLAGHLEIELKVILQVLAHTRSIGNDFDTVFAQFGRGTNAGQLQQLRRIDRSGRYDHLAARTHGLRLVALHITDADRPALLKDDPRCQRVGADL